MFLSCDFSRVVPSQDPSTAEQIMQRLQNNYPDHCLPKDAQSAGTELSTREAGEREGAGKEAASSRTVAARYEQVYEVHVHGTLTLCDRVLEQSSH